MSMGYSRMAYVRCNGSIFTIGGKMRCLRKSTYLENGYSYCGVHAPSKIAARAAKRQAKSQEVTP